MDLMHRTFVAHANEQDRDFRHLRSFCLRKHAYIYPFSSVGCDCALDRLWGSRRRDFLTHRSAALTRWRRSCGCGRRADQLPGLILHLRQLLLIAIRRLRSLTVVRHQVVVGGVRRLCGSRARGRVRLRDLDVTSLSDSDNLRGSLDRRKPTARCTEQQQG